MVCTHERGTCIGACMWMCLCMCGNIAARGWASKAPCIGPKLDNHWATGSRRNKNWIKRWVLKTKNVKIQLHYSRFMMFFSSCHRRVAFKFVWVVSKPLLMQGDRLRWSQLRQTCYGLDGWRHLSPLTVGNGEDWREVQSGGWHWPQPSLDGEWMRHMWFR
jgi:hypothetical protein